MSGRSRNALQIALDPVSMEGEMVTYKVTTFKRDLRDILHVCSKVNHFGNH